MPCHAQGASAIRDARRAPGTEHKSFVAAGRVPLGDECTEGPDGLAYDATCEFVHAVPDPLDDFHTFAICEIAPGERRVVRLYHFGGQCRDLAQDTRVFPRARFSKLAIALPRYWP